jgi:CHAT domain-containing protein
MHYINELVHVTTHGPFDSQESAESWIASYGEPVNQATTLYIEEAED